MRMFWNSVISHTIALLSQKSSFHNKFSFGVAESIESSSFVTKVQAADAPKVE